VAVTAIPGYSLSDPSVLAFIIIPVTLVLLLAYGGAAACRRAGETPRAARRVAVTTLVLAVVWMGATWTAAQSGILRQWDRQPPPFAVLVLAIFAIALAMACSRFGGRLATFLPLWVLVAVQGFRLPLELAMHRMYERGIMPVQMSYSGRNFDIITGMTAIAVAALVSTGRAGRGLVFAWNILGLALLANVVVIAIVSTPALQFFGPEQVNVWVMDPPFVWLPAVMVLAALAGHLLVFRALAVKRGAI
jgi:hypothetical protein